MCSSAEHPGCLWATCLSPSLGEGLRVGLGYRKSGSSCHLCWGYLWLYHDVIFGVCLRPSGTAGGGVDSVGWRWESTQVSSHAPPTQRGNPVLQFVRNVPWEFGEVQPDYVLGQSTCALFLR